MIGSILYNYFFVDKDKEAREKRYEKRKEDRQERYEKRKEEEKDFKWVIDEWLINHWYVIVKYGIYLNEWPAWEIVDMGNLCSWSFRFGLEQLQEIIRCEHELLSRNQSMREPPPVCQNT